MFEVVQCVLWQRPHGPGKRNEGEDEGLWMKGMLPLLSMPTRKIMVRPVPGAVILSLHV